MCGIAGYFGTKNLENDVITKTLAVLLRRGPDYQKYKKYSIDDFKSLHFFHTRLSIIDLDPRSNQPLEDSLFSLVFNGELYNYLEIKKDLESKGIKFLTLSDTEVILKGYQVYGKDLFNTMEGMWALCIYDKKKKEIVISRDKFSEKPLYYYISKEGFYFSSDVKVIKILSKDSFAFNNKLLISGLVCGYKSRYKKLEETFFQNIKNLPSGHFAVINLLFDFSIKKYWAPNTKTNKNLKEDEIIFKAKKLFFNAIKIRLRSDVPLAFCLSGGIDSGSLVSIAAKKFNTKINSFSIIDNRDERYNEKKNIDLIVDDVGADHHEIKLEKKSNNLDYLRELIDYKSAPLSTITSYIHSFLEKKISDKGFKVSFSGIGADEIFTGYYDHYLQYLHDVKNTEYFDSSLENFNKYIKPSIRNKFFQNENLYIQDPNFRKHIYDNADQFSELLYPEIKNEFVSDFKEEKFCTNLSLNRRLNELFHEVTPLMLNEEDSNSMFYSIENRSPFLDSKLVDFMNSVETKYLIKDGYSKNILREVSRGYLVDSVRMDRVKKGFNSSVNSIFDFNDKNFCETILNKKNKIYDFIDNSKLRKILQQDISKNHYSKFVFSLINLNIFFEKSEL
jgi:asparagine synthase (glutamine-hydrolysing)